MQAVNEYDNNMRNRTQDDYYAESRRLRAVVMDMAKELIGHPISFTVYNGIVMNVEVTNSDLRNLANKNTRNNKFNAIKNALAMASCALITNNSR